MRRTASDYPVGDRPAAADTHLGATLRRLLPYLWQHKWRVVLALSCLVGAKIANVGVPLIFKEMIDDLGGTQQVLLLPALLLLLYGALRFSASLFAELREILFARVTQHAVRRIALEVFRHLHELSLRFHLERQTGGVSRDIERGSRSISSLISYTLYSILPTLIEISIVLTILLLRYDIALALITMASLAAYIVFTVTVSNWRITLRRQLNEADSAANTRAIDSLLNYETVKYFNNEDYEARRYDQRMQLWEDAATRSQVSLSWLNLGQQAIIALGVTAMMWRAASGVVDGSMTIGDLVLVNAFLIQLYMPLNFLGVVYREIRQGRFGGPRDGGGTWRGLFIKAGAGSDVKAVAGGRVVFAEWMRGFGNLLIVDHGDSYLTIYGNNDSLLKQVGQGVKGGETVATVGNSGGNPDSGLYFEIRHQGQPVDPMKWASLK